jgi:GcrA cell cycle regulator
MASNTWTPEKTVEVRRLWLEGKLTAEAIAQKFGVTRSAVIGKAHRLGLPMRRPGKVKSREEGEILITLENKDEKQCAWPMGDPKGQDFHFCGEEVVPGKSYCKRHSSIATYAGSALDNQERYINAVCKLAR